MIGMNWTKSVGKIGGIIWVDWAIRSQIAATWKKIDFHCISSLWIIRSFISNQLKLIQSWFNRNPLKNPPDIDLKMTPNWHETDMKLTYLNLEKLISNQFKLIQSKLNSFDSTVSNSFERRRRRRRRRSDVVAFSEDAALGAVQFAVVVANAAYRGKFQASPQR